MDMGRMCHRVMAAAAAAAMIAGGVALNVGRAFGQAGPLPAIADAQKTVITAVVTAVDLPSREVTVKGPNRTVTVHVSNDVPNLDQVKVGDRVKVTYYESYVLEGKKASVGDNSVRAMGSSQVADLRGQGGAGKAEQQTIVIVAKVYAIDKNTGSITLKGPKGNFRTFQVKDKSLLTHFTIGDNVVFKYTEAWAVALAKA